VGDWPGALFADRAQPQDLRFQFTARIFFVADTLTPLQLEKSVGRLVRLGKASTAIVSCENALGKLPISEYHKALGLNWLKQVPQAAKWLSKQYALALDQISVRAIYCEMNRFEINAAEWYLDFFAYDFFGGKKDLSWLCAHKGANGERSSLRLTGMTAIQKLFARDYVEEPPNRIRAASQIVILLLTLRMQELIQAATQLARQNCQLPDDLPVLAAAHDSDLVCFCYGRTKPPITTPEPAKPTISTAPKSDGRLGIYELDGGWDEFHNSLPWDVLDYANERVGEKLADALDKAEPLARKWERPRVKVRQRMWRCDIFSHYPHWAVNKRARKALCPLLKSHVEFLPLQCRTMKDLWLLHPLRHIDLSSEAEHNGWNGDNMSVVRKYAFDPTDLNGLHVFSIKQAPGSAARSVGFCFTGTYVSEEFKRIVATSHLQGVVFNEVLSYRPSR
jgi:hypothetical protein